MQRVRDTAPLPVHGSIFLVPTLDERNGRVVAKVDELGIRDRTLIIFQSDRGHSTETRTFGGGGNAGPYRGAKGCLFEGGIAKVAERLDASLLICYRAFRA